jgi:chemotaxis protein CheD
MQTIPDPAQQPGKVFHGFEGINRYWDRQNHTYAAKILPGEFYVTTNDELIVTVLGSCVSACIRDPIFGIGGMNHFMLPQNANTGASKWENDNLTTSARYGNVAMEHLINNIIKHGGNRDNLEVKIFGGGKILAQMTDIGNRNISFVLDYLNIEGFEIASQDLGDIYPRKILYHPLTGKVRLKKLRSLNNDTIITREKMYLNNLEAEPVEGEIDLF